MVNTNNRKKLNTMKRTKVIDVLKRQDYGNEVKVCGWVRTKRGSKSVNFIALNDGSTINNVQIVADSDKFDEVLKNITTGACLCVSGTLTESIGSGQNVEIQANNIELLEYHGATSVFCEIDKNPYSWIYLPSEKHDAHRIICTGNFSNNNNATLKNTATIEFTDYISKEDIITQLRKIPLNPKYITHNYEKYTYPIQNSNTRGMIKELKKVLAIHGFYLCGRFAEWEYYNMDICIGSALDLFNNELSK